MQSNERMGVIFMLYLIDEYNKQYPHRRLCEIQKFENAEKYLHEMTIDEVNSECADWEAVSSETAANTKRKIAQYLNWLSEQGCDVGFNASDIALPIKEDIAPQIYSTNDIHRCYDTLKMALERSAVQNGSNVSMFFLNMSHAAGVLAFYGLTDNEILNIDLSDVQPSGINGYDLPLTEEDIDVLLQYKYQTKCSNNLVLQGTKYFRNTKINGSVNMIYVNRPIMDISVERKYQYLKTVLKTSYISLCGKFDRAYRMEKCTNMTIMNNHTTPQWFSDIFQVSKNMLVRRRKEYIAYRDQRNASMPESECETYQSKEAICDRIDTIQKHINDLNKEVEELRKKLQT